MTTLSPWADAQDMHATLLEIEIICDVMMCVHEMHAPERAHVVLGWLIDRQDACIAKAHPIARRLLTATRPKSAIAGVRS